MQRQRYRMHISIGGSRLEGQRSGIKIGVLPLDYESELGKMGRRGELIESIES